jgi:NADH-quinone oxidoreductase subunit J
LVIYVGAIAVLFLFVLIMLNIKFSELTESLPYFLPFSVVCGILFLFELIYLFRFEFVFLKLFQGGSDIFLSDFLNTFTLKSGFSDLAHLFSNIQVVSFALFNDFLFCFFVSGLVLLLAMIGTITLTLKKK